MSGRRFAAGTKVPVNSTKIEIEATLVRFGADSFTSGYVEGFAFILFRARDRWIRLSMPLPTEVGDAESRRLWRSMLLLVKAKLSAIADGIVEFEQEFMPHIVMADSRTVWERAKEQIALEYQSGQVRPLMLPAPKERP